MCSSERANIGVGEMGELILSLSKSSPPSAATAILTRQPASQAKSSPIRPRRRRRRRQQFTRPDRRTLYFFGAPFKSLPSSSSSSSSALMSLSPLLLLLLLLVSPLDNNSGQCLCLSQPPSSSPTSRPAALVANSIFDTILGRTTPAGDEQAAASNSSAGAAAATGNSAVVGSARARNSNFNENSAAQSNSQQQAAAAAAADLQHQSYKNGQTSDKVTLPGDILLGGLFPIHMKGTKVECGEINRDRGIQRLEAMLYALDKINEDSRLLPDIKLGAILLDSCSSSTYALNQSLEFIRASINTVESSAFECKDKSAPRPKYGSKMIAGVIGGSYSEVSLQVANLLRLFRIPQVSYASTGTALSDKSLYDLFARTVPSDMFQARAIADIVLKLNWSYVSLVSSEGLYGDSGSKEFMKQASVRRICIATHEKVSPATDMNAYDSIIANLLKRNATGVVLFTRAEDTRELLLAVKRARLFHNFAWVAADGWGTHQKLVEGVEEVALGAITVELQAKAIPGFDGYMKALTPWQNGRNPWFAEYWQEWFDCQLQQSLLQQQQLASGAYKRRQSSALDWLASSNSAGDDDNNNNNEPGGSDYESVAAAAARKRRSSPPRPSGAAATDATSGPGGQVLASSTSTSASLIKRRSPQQQRQEMKQFCSPNLRISESNGYRQEQKVQFVVDAVYAMAHALHKAWANLCDAQPGVVCEALKELNGGDFYSKYLLNVSFKDLAGSEVKFDERGDGLGRYNIYNYRQVRPALPATEQPPQNYSADIPGELEPNSNGFAEMMIGGGGDNQPTAARQSNSAGGSGFGSDAEVEHIFTSNNEFEYSTVGRWTESDYFLRLDDIQFIQGEAVIPESYCSRPCELGQAKIMRAGDHCCWICKTCAPYEFLPDEFSCKDCGIGRWPVANKTSCFELPQKYLRWDSLFSLISLSISCLGIALTLFVSVIFIKYIDTPVVKASGRELSFILLAGIAFCHLCTFVLLAKPTALICGGQRFLVNFGFSLMYASLLVKTNRISRIFNCARKSAKRPSFISPKSQMLITGILVAIQIFLTIVWFVFEPPGIRADSPEGKRDEVILKCRAKGKSFIISLVYNMILITTCTVYAVKTRKIPENFNESKFIGFTMYTTIVIWLAFVTMFFGTNNSYEIQINTMCVCISLSAYVTLFCLFSPKISIILLHPDKNVRKLTMNSATYKRPLKQVSSHASLEGAKSGAMNTNYSNMGTGGAGNGGAGANATYSGGAGGHETKPTTGSGQTDGPSGGPVSTTSNMLNPADSQRLQESSIASNCGALVNSNSAGSQSCNGSKTPTTLSQQQLVLVATCANCGSHQLAPQQPTGSSTAVTDSMASGQARAASTHKHQQQQHQAKVLHSSRTPTIKDDGELALKTMAGKNQSTSVKSRRHIGSLDRLDDAQRQADESCSSLANDSSLMNQLMMNSSLIPTSSQENTPCSMPIGHAISKQRHVMATVSDVTPRASTAHTEGELVHAGAAGHYISGKGSDSMLWNQSDYSIDYCSDCCPDSSSYCNCSSCQACLSAAMIGGSKPAAGGTDCATGHLSSGRTHASTSKQQRLSSGHGDCRRVGGSIDYIYHAHPTETSATPAEDELDIEDELDLEDNDFGDLDDGDMEALGVDESELRGNDYDSRCQHHRQTRAASDRVARIRRRKSEEPSQHRYRMDLEEPVFFFTGQQRQLHDSSTRKSGKSSAQDKKRSQTMELRTIHRTPADSSSASQDSGGHEPATKTKRPAKCEPSVAYALQTAAHSALGTCAANAQVSTGGLDNTDPQQTTRAQLLNTTSIKDKPSERAAASNQHQAAAGPIQASLDLVKQVSHQMQQQQLWSKKASTSYHDDYEYSYGLVQPPAELDEDDADGGRAELVVKFEQQQQQQQLIPADGSGRVYKLKTTTRKGGARYEASDLDDLSGELIGGGASGSDNDDDDFEHDGRLSINRPSTTSSGSQQGNRASRHSASTRTIKSSSRSKAKQQPPDGLRINSVALIAATLSAGGAIVESGGTTSDSSTGRQEQQKAHLH